MTTAISEWVNGITGLVVNDFTACGVEFDAYARKCAMAAMQEIWKLVKDSGTSMNEMDRSNLRQVVGQAASLKLNASAVPRECYFQLRNVKAANGSWGKVVEMGIEGDGYDAMLRNFGVGVRRIYPCWLVHDGDEFTYPKHVGIQSTPPTWEPRGMSERVVRVVYPVELDDGTVDYRIAEREGVRANLVAHVRNNLRNETFGIAKSRYEARPEQKAEIDARKEAVMAELRACRSVDEMLSCQAARPYISPAWLDTPEAMIVRKMRNNAIRKFPKDFDTMANASYNHMDDVWVAAHEGIEANANTVAYIPEEQQPQWGQAEQTQPQTQGESQQQPQWEQAQPQWEQRELQQQQAPLPQAQQQQQPQREQLRQQAPQQSPDDLPPFALE